MPLLLLTRPRAQSRQFLAECRAEAPSDFAAVISPLTEVVPTGVGAPATGDLAFTSGRAVELAGDLSGRTAWCVGARTAELARAAGADAREAEGDVEALLALLLIERPAEVTHLRGEPSRGDLATRLRSAGIAAGERILYRTESRPLSPEALTALSQDRVIAPAFSPRGAALLAEAAVPPPALVVAISPAAAEPFDGICQVRIASRPNAGEVRRLVLSALCNLP